jgi:hypothetical protein
MVHATRTGPPLLAWAMGIALLVLAGCAGDESGGSQGPSGATPSGSDLTGLWRFGFYVGAQDDFSTYQLEQTGTSVTGGHCQTSYVASDSGAEYLLDSVACETATVTGTFTDPALQLQYGFVEAGQSYTTTFQGTVSPDGGRLSGTGHSTKCSCDFEFRAARQALGQPAPQL